MPYVWLRFAKDGTTDFVRDNWDPEHPERLEAAIGRAVERTNGRMVERLFFDVGREMAYVLVSQEVDDMTAIKAISRLLGATGMTKLIPAEHMKEAVALSEELAAASET